MTDSLRITNDAYLKRRWVTWLTMLTAVFLTAGMSGCAHSQAGNDAKGYPPDGVLIDVLYATDRNVTGNDDPGRYYGGDRGEMSYGCAQVTVRPDKAKSPFADYSMWQVDPGEKIRSRAALRTINPVDKDVFLRDIRHRATASSDSSALVYLHGYGRKFVRAINTTGTLVYELSYRGVPVLYSWPSKGSAEAYPADRTAIEWSTPHLEAFLDDLATHTDVSTIHLLAHSLGNRALLKTLVNLINNDNKDREWKFGEIILTAPDIDRAIFERDYAPVLANARSRITLYVSSIDVPLTASRKINRYPRVGDAKDRPVIVAGVQTIDAAEVTNLLIGHSYYRDSPYVLSDLYFLLDKRLPASKRPTVKPAVFDGRSYWKIIPELQPANAKTTE